MKDPRIKKLASILTDYSVKIKKGDIISVSCSPEAEPLVIEVCKNILKKGAIPKLNVGLNGFAKVYYETASKEQLEYFPKLSWEEAKLAAGEINIFSTNNTKDLSKIDSKKIATRRKVLQKISDHIVNVKNNWVICIYPTNAFAQDAEMSLEEFEDFVFSATNLDWGKELKKQLRLKAILEKTSDVRIVGKDTDLSFSIKGKKAKECCGKRNMPDGEVFTEPVKNSVEGHIAYSFPAIKGGREVDGIKLWFKKGKVVKATAEKNEDFLKEMIKTDPGASYVGEFGIGINYGIKKFIKEILFDEKIGGTVHLALGMAYKETGGENKSAIHWDMIKDLRTEGELYFDGKLVQKKGKWLIKF